MPEHPCGVDREGEEIRAGVQCAQVVGQAEFGEVELASGHSGEDLGNGGTVQGDVEAVERHGAVEQGPRVVVAGDGYVEMRRGHVSSNCGATISSTVQRRAESPCS